ncbi:MAG: hypothetical protein EOO39_08900 [Cytophagaceae bacterium]|nr:MAG: hypothetical protein EOO39_08900 [Cytophagaceae bacterium]
MDSNQSLSSLWESYVFRVAALAIDSVPPNEQTKFINLVRQTSLSSSEKTGLEQPRQASLETDSFHSPLAKLEQQWKTALAEPLRTRRSGLESQQVNLPYWALLNQQQIESTKASINRVSRLIERAKQTGSTTPHQQQLLHHFQGIQQTYSAYLVKLKVVQEEQLNRFGK